VLECATVNCDWQLTVAENSTGMSVPEDTFLKLTTLVLRKFNQCRPSQCDPHCDPHIPVSVTHTVAHTFQSV